MWLDALLLGAELDEMWALKLLPPLAKTYESPNDSMTHVRPKSRPNPSARYDAGFSARRGGNRH